MFTKLRHLGLCHSALTKIYVFFFFFFWHLKPGCSSELYGSGVEFTEAQLIQIKVIYCLVLLINWLCLYVFATTSPWQVTKWSWHHCAGFLWAWGFHRLTAKYWIQHFVFVILQLLLFIFTLSAVPCPATCRFDHILSPSATNRFWLPTRSGNKSLGIIVLLILNFIPFCWRRK